MVQAEVEKVGEATKQLQLTCSKSIPWYISTKEYNYFCGGVQHEEFAAKEKRRRRKQNSI